MMETPREIAPSMGAPLTSQSFAALLALTGSRKMDIEGLRSRMKMTNDGFESLIYWLQREYFVDIVSTLEGDEIREVVELTTRGETVLVALLEQMCELPELH
jgi:hypothetical protein